MSREIVGKIALPVTFIALAAICFMVLRNRDGDSAFISRIGSQNVNDFHSSKSSKKSSKQPNFVFILADDLGYNSLSTDVTPFLVNLRDGGISLTNYYAQEACTPSRMSLLTGRYPLTLGWQYGSQLAVETGGLGLDETTLAEAMKENGYTTYIFGKWNLGNQSPRFLPTARGFDYHLGYLDGYNHYWSKLRPDSPTFRDFMYADTECYYMYDGSDLQHYSTNLYKDSAVAAINGHDFDSSPVFMYMSFQADHDPFSDSDNTFSTGVSESFLSSSVYKYITSEYKGTSRQIEYMKALAVLDTATESIYNALDEQGQLDNTYIIFASDNGGCPNGGGRNTPLRGIKGSLFEGGVKVDSFLYSSSMSSKLQGSSYEGLFHVSDWFPTIVALSGGSFSPAKNKDLDGFDHSGALLEGDDSPRDYLLYNFYYNPDEDSDASTAFYKSVPGAIRNSRYKLMHTYDSSLAGNWYTSSMELLNDDDLSTYGTCTQAESWTGDYTYYLFDLQEDPNETTNLYDSDDDDVVAAKEELYAQMEAYSKNAAAWMSARSDSDLIAMVVWQQNNNYVMPWAPAEKSEMLMGMFGKNSKDWDSTPYPENCGLYSSSAFASESESYSKFQKNNR